MTSKTLLVFILCMSLLTSNVSYGASVAENPLASLLTQHRDIKSGVGGMELVSKHGRALLDATYKLMSDPANRDYLNSPDGMELRKHQELLGNFISVKEHFEKCVKDKEAKRKLNERILDSSFQSMSLVSDKALPCLPENYQMFKSFQDLSLQMTKAMNAAVKPQLQNELTKQVMINTAKSLTAFRNKFNPNFMKSGKLSPIELQDLIDEVCVKKSSAIAGPQTHDVCNDMDPLFKLTMAKEVTRFLAKNKTPKISPEEATKSINDSVTKMNKTLEAIQVKKDKGYIFDSAQLENEQTKKDFNAYMQVYMTEISKDAGSLFLTKSIKNESGEIKRLDSSDITKDKNGIYQFEKHKPVKLQDVNRAIKEAEGKMQSQVKDTLDIASKSLSKKGKIQASEEDINDLVMINPFAAGQMVLKEPKYSGLLCDAINKINKNDVDDKNLDKYFTIGSAVLGGALILTGVGAVAGAYLVTGSLTAGVAAGTLGGTILGYTALASSAYELVSLGYQSNRAYNQWEESNKLEAAFLNQNGDNRNVIEAQNALIEFKEARLSAAISLAGLGMNVISAGKLFNILKTTGSKIGTDEIKAATKILQFITQSKAAKTLKDTASALGASGMEKIDNFLLLLARTGETNRIKFLELLQNSKITPEKIKNIIEDALEAAKNCVKT